MIELGWKKYHLIYFQKRNKGKKQQPRQKTKALARRLKYLFRY